MAETKKTLAYPADKINELLGKVENPATEPMRGSSDLITSGAVHNLLGAVDGQHGAHLVRNDELVNGISISATGVVTPNSPTVRYTPEYYRVRDFITANHIYMAERGWADKIMKCNIVLYDKNKKFIARLAYTQDKVFDLTDYPNAELFRVLLLFSSQDNVDFVTDYTDGDLVILTAPYMYATVDNIVASRTSGWVDTYDYPTVSEDGVLDFGADTILYYGDRPIYASTDIESARAVSLDNPNTTSTASVLVYNVLEKKCYPKKYNNPIGYGEVLMGGVRKLAHGKYISNLSFPCQHSYQPVRIEGVTLGEQTNRAYAIIGWIEQGLMFRGCLPNPLYRYAVQCFSGDKGVGAVYTIEIGSEWMYNYAAYKAQWGTRKYKWVRVVFSRVDNADLSATDIAAIEAQMDGTMYSSRAAEATLYGEAMDSYEVNHSSLRYQGERMIPGGYPFSCEKVIKMDNSDYYFQGAAMCGRYFVQLHSDNRELEIYDVESKSIIGSLSLGDNGAHANSAAFSTHRAAETDLLPLLYVQTTGEMMKILCYRIAGNVGSFTISLVQTILLPAGDELMYHPSCAIDPTTNELILYGYAKNSYQDATDNESIIARCVLPSPNSPSFRLTTNSVKDVFRVPFVWVFQGGCAYGGKLYATYGNTATEAGLLQIDLLKKAVTSRLDFSFLGEVEPEGIGVYDNKLWVSFQKPNQSIYKLTL